MYACVALPKLHYELKTLWLRKADHHRLDSFLVRCLRRVHGIPHSYVSRVPNRDVMQIARASTLSALLLQRQLNLFARIARMDDLCPVRRVLFEDNSTNLKEKAGPRGRGRPRQMWSSSVHAHAMQIAGSEEHLHTMLARTPRATTLWKEAVQQYCDAYVQNGDADGSLSE